jgi:hypothetical protein
MALASGGDLNSYSVYMWRHTSGSRRRFDEEETIATSTGRKKQVSPAG